MIRKQKAWRIETNTNSSTVTAEAEGVVFFPGRPGWGMVVSVTLAKTTVLEKKDMDDFSKEMKKRTLHLFRTCLPMLVSPRASRRLWTGFVIQLILGSRRIYEMTS